MNGTQKKRAMHQWIGGLILMAALALISTGALAAPATSVHVGTVTLNDGQSTTAFGGTASYAGGVLTLDGVHLPASQSYIAGYTRYGVYATGDVILALNGTNTIAAADAANHNNSSHGIRVVQGDLTIRGTGSLTVTAGGNGFQSCGITVEQGALIVQGGTIVAKGFDSTRSTFKPAFSRGVSVVQGNGIGGELIVDGGSLFGESYEAAELPPMIWSSTSLGVGAFSITLRKGSLQGVSSAYSDYTDMSFGVYARSPIVMLDGTLIASIAVDYYSALAAGPDFGASPMRYQWKAGNTPAEPAGAFLSSATQPYVWDSAHRYVQIRADVSPTPPPTPQPTPLPTPTAAQNAPKTGDGAAPGLWLALCLLGGVGRLTLAAMKKRRV